MLFAILLLASTPAPAPTDVLAQVRAGRLLCFNPDAAAKTCSGLYSFTPVSAEDDTFVEVAEVLLPHDQAASMEVSTIIHVKGAAMCGTTRLADLRGARIRINGSLLPPVRNTLEVNKLIARLKPLTGRRACETLKIEGGQLLKYGQVQGVSVDLPGKPAAWIEPTSGYNVAPNPNGGVRCITCR